jgi:hypothetical protein
VLGDFGLEDCAQLRLGLGYQHALVAAWADHLFQAAQNFVRLEALAARGLEQRGQQRLDFARLLLQRTDVQSAASSQLQPTLFQKIVIGAAHGVRMDAMAAREGSHARQFVAGGQILA